ncbi:hypothetical protein M413DRAFT_446459 [Hebeloma cylindrosporum]|uniref:non-specific serine/threonine protein kinase n=1 Tax=Hebeloma cylindrosporum TaxID=76867 RepID=A0A0C2YGQ7_HEBCY|nr:hypothetical protein M413DRAFT_446459 [Hebeloma cylindrosporum h7]
MKILIGDLFIADKRGHWDDLGTLKVLQESNPRSPGYAHVCHLLGSFILQGPNGNHIWKPYLLLEAMGPSVLDLYGTLPGAMPLELLKRVCKHVLHALQYLHEDCGIIHTGERSSSFAVAFLFNTLLRYQG